MYSFLYKIILRKLRNCLKETMIFGTIEAVETATGEKVDRTELALRNALKLAKDRELTLIFDEAHTLFASDLCPQLFKSTSGYRPNILLFSA